MKKFLVLGSVVAGTMLFTGCANNINVTKFPNEVKSQAKIPEICKPIFKAQNPRVAVVKFTNNSTFGKADIVDSKSSSKSVSAAGIAVGNGAIVAVAANKRDSKSSTVSRSVDAKLAKSVTPVMESILMSLGGADLYSRDDLAKIENEQKLQDSGLLDPNTVVAIGKTAGVQYIITGSIDNVEQSYRDNEAAAGGLADATKNSKNQTVKLLGALSKVVASATDGMIIKVKTTVKILDVETGKIVMSKTIDGSSNIGKIKEPNYDQVIGGIKSAVNEALEKSREDFGRYFAVKGYITQIKHKGSDYIARVSLGTKHSVSPKDTFNVYQLEEMSDPIAGTTTCDMTQLPIVLKVGDNQIQDASSWTTLDSGEGASLKKFQLIKKSAKAKGMF
jgi:hypothetical protein